MFDVSLTIKAGTAEAPVVFAWEEVSKPEVLELEEQLLEGLMKLNALAVSQASGLLGKGSQLNPLDMQAEFLVLEDGVPWHRTVLEYPKMGDEQRAVFMGIIAGELSELTRLTKSKSKKIKSR